MYGPRYKLQDAQYWPASASDYVNYPNGGGVLDPHLSSPPNFVYSAGQGPWMDDQYDQSEPTSSMNSLKYNRERELLSRSETNSHINLTNRFNFCGLSVDANCAGGRPYNFKICHVSLTCKIIYNLFK